MSQNVIREEAVGFEPVPSVAHLRANLPAVEIQAEVQLLQHRSQGFNLSSSISMAKEHVSLAC
jgi:hypothetical protein